MRLLGETLSTLCALERFFTRVTSFVNLQMVRCWKPLSARVTRVLFLSLVRSSFIVGSSCILFILILNNIIAITEFIKFCLLFDHSFHFTFDSECRCCRCLLCNKFSRRQNFILFPLVVAVFLFYSNRFVSPFLLKSNGKRIRVNNISHYKKLTARYVTRAPWTGFYYKDIGLIIINPIIRINVKLL